MKHFNGSTAYLILSLLNLLWACEPVAKITAVQPAAVPIPEHIQSVLVLNRSHYGSDFTEYLLSGLFGGDNVKWQNASERQTVKALQKRLAKIPGCKAKLSKREMAGLGEGKLPPPLTWSTIDSICKADSCDALVALEYYTADVSTTESQRDVVTKDKDNKDITSTEYTLNGTTKLNLGWRFYDSKAHTILDEFSDQTQQPWTKTVSSKSDLKYERNNINADQVSAMAGTNYGNRFATDLVKKYSRPYFGKGNDQMKSAAAKSKSGDWEGAIGIWKAVLTGNDKELAGKAAYNVAVACEVKGELESAKVWAEKSYAEFGNEKAKDYLSLLNNRINER